MPKTLLAVDDSATMRKVMEITFSGDDFKVVTANGRQTALSKLDESPAVVLVDSALDTDDGYALCKEIRGKAPQAVLIMLSSKFHPYDPAKGKEAGADDFMDKPFDTQAAIDKVKKLLTARDGGAVALPLSPSASSPPADRAQPVAAAAARPMMNPRNTVIGVQAPQPTPPPPVAAAPPVVVAPAPVPMAAHASAPAAPSNAIEHAVNGEMSSKLLGLGLSQLQAEAVLALSRDVIERVVWEVVPQLAETLIKEEISRLTRE